MIFLKQHQFHFLIADFNLLSCESENFTFKLLYSVILYILLIEITILLLFPVKSVRQFLLLLQE